jgi:hypothetical protein
MEIKFEPGRWEEIRKIYGMWWEGTLERPIVPVILEKKESTGSQPDIPLLSQANCNDLSIPATKLVDRIEYELSRYTFLGDAFPCFNMDCYGPGVIAAFLGANLDNSTGNVWFHPREVVPIKELHFEYDSQNIWLNRIKEIYSEAVSRLHGQILFGMPDLGGPIDILSTFRPADNLLFDLYDYPEEVSRLVWELHDLWHKYFNELNKILMPVNPGYTSWCSVYCEKPAYILQGDFTYMISPEMFNEFVKPELEATCKVLPHSIYHLDGIGQLNHLQHILDIKELDAIQWVPGDGKPDQSNWPEVHKKVMAQGKNILLYHGLDCLDSVTAQLGTYKGVLHMPIRDDISKESEYRRKLEKYGIC